MPLILPREMNRSSNFMRKCLCALLFAVRKPPAGVEAQVIRITQEAVRHSGASRGSVGVQHAAAAVTVVVADDGCVFDHAADWEQHCHFGLLGMRELAGLIGATLAIDAPAADGGTRVRLIVPCTSTKRAKEESETR